MASFDLTLDLFGIFFFALEQDADSGNMVRVWVLGVDGRSSCVASDRQTYIASHWPALLFSPSNLNGKIRPEEMIVLDKDRVLWLFDGHQLAFTPTGGTQQALAGHFKVRQPFPPDNTNQDYFSWVADMGSVVPGAQLRPELFGPDPPGLSCRMVLDFGAFTSAELGMANNNVLNFSFEKLHVTSSHAHFGALANGVSVYLGNFDSVLLQRIPIAGADDLLRVEHDVQLIDDGSGKARITLFNTPPEHILPTSMSMTNDTYVAHFELFYGLLQNPPAQLLVPCAKDLVGPGPTNHNVSCPPGSLFI